MAKTALQVMKLNSKGACCTQCHWLFHRLRFTGLGRHKRSPIPSCHLHEQVSVSCWFYAFVERLPIDTEDPCSKQRRNVDADNRTFHHDTAMILWSNRPHGYKDYNLRPVIGRENGTSHTALHEKIVANERSVFAGH